MNLQEAELILKQLINQASLTTVERIAAREALGTLIQSLNRLGTQVNQLNQQIELPGEQPG